MSNSPYSGLNDRAFAFSMDAAAAVVLLASIIYILMAAPFSQPNISKAERMQVIDDALTALDNNGFLLNTIDTQPLALAVVEIHDKLMELVPGNLDFNLNLRQFMLDVNACRDDGEFSGCFPDANALTATTGSAAPEYNDVFKGRRFIMKGQPPGDCNIEYGGLAPKNDYFGPIYFSVAEPVILFANGNDSNITVDVNTTPLGPGPIECGQEVDVEITLTSLVGIERAPLDLILILDRSSSMDELTFKTYEFNGTLDGNSTGDCANRTDHNRVATFSIPTISDPGVPQDYRLQANLSAPDYNGDCSNAFLRLISPRGIEYDDNSASVTVDVPNNEDGDWHAEIWSDDNVSYDLNIMLSKFAATKDASKEFIDSAEWTAQDYTALVSYGEDAKTESPLSSNRNAVKNKIHSLQLENDDDSAIGEGIYEATDELQPPPLGHGREDVLRFQVVVSDGQTNTGRDSEAAAIDAASRGIVIYTVGIGSDHNADELMNIASITGGTYYAAEDTTRLKEVYDIIAKAVVDMASTALISDLNVVLPIPAGAVVVDDGNGTVAGGYIVFERATMLLGVPWLLVYTLNFPCNDVDNCGVNSLLLPGEGSYYSYYDESGQVQEYAIDENAVLTFLMRDLQVNVLEAYLVGQDNLMLDVNVANTDDLDTSATNLVFRWLDLNGNLLDERNVPILNSGQEVIYTNVNLGAEGVIYVKVDENTTMSQCPWGDYDIINCYGSPSMQYYVLDYYMWRK